MTYQGIREPVLVCVFTTLYVIATPTSVQAQELGQSIAPTVSEPVVTEPVVTETAVAQQSDAEEASDVQATPVVDTSEPEVGTTDKSPVESNGLLRFSFDGVAWSEVIQWLADEAELALHVGDLPTGSLTYSDPSEFTVEDAIDRINLFLLAEGFALVRTDQMLSVINLSDPRGVQQLDALAELVTPDQLDERNPHDVVKCILALGDIKAEEASQELAALKLMTTPTVLTKTNQLMITDTVAKLLNVRAVLSAFEPDKMDNGTVVQTFHLKHVDAEDVLVVARPHLGLATGEMIGIDVSISSDLLGKTIFVTGVEDKVKLIEGLVESIDQPEKSLSPNEGEMELKSYLVEGGNVEMIYNVLQTLLAGKTVRLSMDEDAESVVALAPPEIHKEIAMTVTQLQTAGAEFAVIPLKKVDPYLAISLLEEMLDLPDSLDDDEDVDPDAPKIDADPENMRLFVRAKKHEITQIKAIIEQLDEGDLGQKSDRFRVFPLKGRQAEHWLETTARFWRNGNPILYYPLPDSDSSDQTERVVHPDVPTETKRTAPPTKRLGDAVASRELTPKKTTKTGHDDFDALHLIRRSANDSMRSLNNQANQQASPIICQMTPRGLLLHSDDVEALEQFEDDLRTLAGPASSIPSPPIVFYLKHTKADDALRMLAELLDGGEAASEGENGTLVNGFVSSSSSDGFLGSLITSRDGTTTMITGSITVVADPRLNRLIAQGTTNDVERIEDYLAIIDRDQSLTKIETYGTTHIIELLHAKASEVAASIRDAYAGRINSSASTTASGKPGDPKADAKAEASAKEASKKTNSKQAAAAPVRNLEPKMTVAVHEPSNSLIVTAPQALFDEVSQLVQLIDQRDEETIEVIVPSNAAMMGDILQQVMGAEGPPRSKSTSPSASRTTTSRSKSER